MSGIALYQLRTATANRDRGRLRRESPLVHMLWLVGLFLALLPTQHAAAANALEDISYATLPGNRVQVKLSLSGPADEPLSFTIDNPARLALDFPQTNVSLARKSQSIGVGAARSVTAVEAGGRTRVVLNLVRLVPYTVSTEGNKVLITLESVSGGIAAAKTPPRPRGVTEGAQVHSIDNVDFHRGEQGEGRVVITLSDPSTVVDLRQEGGTVVADFIDTSLPEQLERRLNVVDFATPVKTVDTFAQGNNVRMVITPLSEDYEHLAYQTENVLTVDIKPITREEQEKKRKEKFGYVGEKLSLNFQNIEVRAVLQLIADFTGLNLVASDSVQGNLTLRLKNVPWDQALDIILKTKGLAKRQMGNVILVAPTEEIAAREKLELESQKQIEELAPLRSEFVQVNYAKAEDLAELIKAKENSLLSERGNVTVDSRTNTLLVQDTARNLADIRRLVSTLDIPVRQVLIESRIVIANDDFSKDLGVRFGVTSATSDRATNEQQEFVSGNLNAIDDLVDQDPLEISDSLNVNLPASPIDATAASIGLAIAKLPFGTLLELELSALQQEGRGEIISNPRVITANQKEALIEQGTEIPYLEASSSGAATISFKKAVLSLKVRPHITPDDRIIMDLTVTQDSPGDLVQLLGSSVPAIDTQEVTTQVLVDNGETVVLGGVYQRTKRNDVDRVPFFGDLPYVGFLFKQRTEQDDKRELLIFVTPKIIKETLSLS